MIAASDSSYRAIFFWAFVLIILVVVGFFLAVWVKRRTQQPDISQPTLGFSLADLRELHRTGKISDQEYERARGKMAASLKRKEAAEKPKKPQ
jgi:uncharacterized membrane protein